MSESKEVKLSSKVMINKEKTKVLFAEADNHFMDVLLSFLTLPLGKIVRILEKQYGKKAPVFGNITSLYKGLSNLDDFYFSTEGAKQMLLNPAISLAPQCRKLKLNISDSQPPRYYTCDRYYCPENKLNHISMYYGISTCVCGGVLKEEVNRTSSSSINDVGNDGVFTIDNVSFIISDDLRIVPNEIGIMQTLNNLGIKDMDGAEPRVVAFGFNEMVDLLMGTIFSPTPLSDLVFKKKQLYSVAKPESRILLNQIKKEESSNSKKIIVKVLVQKSTNKLLFAQAKDDFVELLSSFLIIPIGGVSSLLKGNTCLKSIDNLYTSLANAINDKYIPSSDTKTKLMKPNLPHGYISKNQLLPLSEESAPRLCYKHKEKRGKKPKDKRGKKTIYSDHLISSYKSPKGEGNYVKESTTYILSDDLKVTPFCMTSTLAVINQMNIPFADVNELDVQIGLDEALSILKASLRSTSALSDGLMNRKMMKRPKTEN